MYRVLSLSLYITLRITVNERDNFQGVRRLSCLRVTSASLSLCRTLPCHSVAPFPVTLERSDRVSKSHVFALFHVVNSPVSITLYHNISPQKALKMTKNTKNTASVTMRKNIKLPVTNGVEFLDIIFVL